MLRRVLGIAILGDAMAIGVGLLLAFWLRFRSGWIPSFGDGEGSVLGTTSLDSYAKLCLLGGVLFLATMVYMQLYDLRHVLRPGRFARNALRAACFWLGLYLCANEVLRFGPSISRVFAVLAFIATFVCLTAWRCALSGAAGRFGWTDGLRQRLTVVGRTDEAVRLMKAVERDGRHPYVLAPESGLSEEARSAGELARLIDGHNTDIVLVADLSMPRDQLMEIASACERAHVEFKMLPDYFQVLLAGLHLETISGVPILGITQLPLDRFANRCIKRGIDIIGAVVGLLIATPIMAVFGLIVYVESPGAVLYRQVRTGRRGGPFTIFKIRSMRMDAEASSGARWAQQNDPRRLRIGTFMRRWNIDEVPQFWNVLVGDMSLVGPRPERPELIEKFKYEIPHYNARHAAKPGITGWAQVNGLRGDTDLSERVRCDLWYLENWSVWLDFQIMAMTFLSRKNAY
jgi:exopolysaccharide biosynthesis polyprenyl glycosylphosphotransferase